MQDIDKATISRLMKGEESAYLHVAGVLRGPVYRFVLHLCRNSDAAEDITQETFVAVWQNVRSFRGKSRFSTWVFGIAYRQYLMHRNRHRMDPLQFDDRQDEAEIADPNDLLQAAEQAFRVRDAVDRLPLIYREVVTLVHLQGLTYREAAGVLDVPIGTVKSRANAAFNILRKLLEENEVSDCEVRQSESISGQ